MRINDEEKRGLTMKKKLRGLFGNAMIQPKLSL
jgi:hypothetical protein